MVVVSTGTYILLLRHPSQERSQVSYFTTRSLVAGMNEIAIVPFGSVHQSANCGVDVPCHSSPAMEHLKVQEAM